MWPFKNKIFGRIVRSKRNNRIITETNKRIDKISKYKQMCKRFMPLNEDQQSALSSYLKWFVFFKAHWVLSSLPFISSNETSNIRNSNVSHFIKYNSNTYSYAFLRHHNIVLLSIFDTVWKKKMSYKNAATNFHVKNVDIESYFIMYCCTVIRKFFAPPCHL